MSTLTNRQIASVFRETAALLQAQAGDSFRQRAYERAAQTIDGLTVDLRELHRREGRAGLIGLPSIGRSLAASIEEFLQTGHCRTLDRLRGHISPERLFCKIPGIGEALAHRIHERLHVETLEELEAAAHDGRLATVPGIGEVRAQAVADHLRYRLDTSPRRSSRARPANRRQEPPAEVLPIAHLLEIDREYRGRVERDELPRVAPVRFNPEGIAWMPVWHTVRAGWTLSVMPSNSARAHRLGKTHDWVIIVAMRDGHEEQFTVVTEYQGDMLGLRVVRGHEAECRGYYAQPQEHVIEAVHKIVASLS